MATVAKSNLDTFILYVSNSMKLCLFCSKNPNMQPRPVIIRPRWLTGSDESPARLTEPCPYPVEVEGAVGVLEEEHDLIPGWGSTDLHTIYILFEEAAFWNPSARSSQWHHGWHFRGKRRQRERAGRRWPAFCGQFQQTKNKILYFKYKIKRTNVGNSPQKPPPTASLQYVQY